MGVNHQEKKFNVKVEDDDCPKRHETVVTFKKEKRQQKIHPDVEREERRMWREHMNRMYEMWKGY
jgi:hypothetical protein